MVKTQSTNPPELGTRLRQRLHLWRNYWRKPTVETYDGLSRGNPGTSLLGTVFKVFIGGMLILVGIVGLVLPVIPGLLLIAFGGIVLFRLLKRKHQNV